MLSIFLLLQCSCVFVLAVENWHNSLGCNRINRARYRVRFICNSCIQFAVKVASALIYCRFVKANIEKHRAISVIMPLSRRTTKLQFQWQRPNCFRLGINNSLFSAYTKRKISSKLYNVNSVHFAIPAFNQ